MKKRLRILLIGEYSNVHNTLAQGLRALGHEVTVMSNGNTWRNYPRDIDISRRPGKWGRLCYVLRLCRLLPKMRGYDVVQLINPVFLDLKAERIFPVYRYLRKHNKKVFLGAFGNDYYWVNTGCTTMPLRYGDFNMGKQLRNTKDALLHRGEWLGTAKERLNKMIAADCDGIIAGLYEYWVCYQPVFPQKTVFIPFPIVPLKDTPDCSYHEPLKIFIGIDRMRSEYKGTDIMLRAAKAIKKRYADRVELRTAEDLPFEEYRKRMDGSDVILDQLYSYTPSMNPLEAMKKGIVCVGGGEPENYEILNESELRPIVNVLPNEESVYGALEQLVVHPERIPQLKKESVMYVRQHHDYIDVARKYEALYRKNDER
uniref:Glycosyltransferase n=1 Tax=Prevotella sp. GTC17262 TaxID=3236797 RepID=A0AB33JPW4_9BACT